MVICEREPLDPMRELVCKSESLDRMMAKTRKLTNWWIRWQDWKDYFEYLNTWKIILSIRYWNKRVDLYRGWGFNQIGPTNISEYSSLYWKICQLHFQIGILISFWVTISIFHTIVEYLLFPVTRANLIPYLFRVFLIVWVFQLLSVTKFVTPSIFLSHNVITSPTITFPLVLRRILFVSLRYSWIFAFTHLTADIFDSFVGTNGWILSTSQNHRIPCSSLRTLTVIGTLLCRTAVHDEWQEIKQYSNQWLSNIFNKKPIVENSPNTVSVKWKLPIFHCSNGNL